MSRFISHNDVKIPRSCQRPFLLSIARPSEDIFTLALAPLTETLALGRRKDRERNAESIARIPKDWVLRKREVHTDEASFDIREYRNGGGNEFRMPKSKNETRRDGGFPILVCGEDTAHEGEQPLRIVVGFDIDLREDENGLVETFDHKNQGRSTYDDVADRD
jgi:hypothetical protein